MKLQINHQLRGLAAVVSVLLFCLVPGYAQSTSSIQGNTIDSDGAVVPGVRITVVCDCKECPTRPCSECCPSGFTGAVTSDEQGDFRINDVPVGTYVVIGDAAGFGKAEVHGVIVRLSAASSLTLTLKRKSNSVAAAEKSAARNDATSEESARLQVRIIDRETDKPLENAKVTLLWQCDCKKECPTKPCSECCPSERTLFSTVTDASGTIIFDGPPGTYRIDTAYRAYSKDSLVTVQAGEKEKVKVSLVLNEKP
jgi:Carboxypeptidase regulatory-like domain